MASSLHRIARLLAWAAVVLVWAPALFGAEIKLKSGTVYSNAKILHQDAHSIEIQVQFGVINIPIATIESIDGVALGQTRPVVPTNQPSQAVRPVEDVPPPLPGESEHAAKPKPREAKKLIPYE